VDGVYSSHTTNRVLASTPAAPDAAKYSAIGWHAAMDGFFDFTCSEYKAELDLAYSLPTGALVVLLLRT
jgi:hypothetical protein